MNLPPVNLPSDGDAPAIIEPLCAVFRRTLKGEGLKYTPERAQILDAVVRREDVFQAEQLMASLKASGVRVSKATVYRTIKLLAQAGIIQQVLFDDDQSHYQLAYGRRASVLVVNTQTGQIENAAAPELAGLVERICAERGLDLEAMRVVVYARPSGA